MGEAITEDAAADAETREASKIDAPLEERIEKENTAESIPIDREGYQPEGRGRYAKTVEYKRASKKPASKKSLGKSGLERAVEDSKAIAKEFGVDTTETLSAMFTKSSWRPLNSNEDSMPNERKRNGDNYDTYDGVTYLIFHQDPETGEVYLSVEVKTASYKIAEARGKLALHGETGKVGENFLDNAVRGLKEENPDSYPILLKALRENRCIYHGPIKHIDGVPSETTFICLQVEDNEEWNKYLADKNPEAPKVIMSLSEFSKTNKRDWAFDHYDFISGFKDYADSIIPKHADLSMRLSSPNNSRQYNPQFQISSTFYNPN